MTNSQANVPSDLGVSVVIPCFNAGRYLRDTIESITVQEYAGPIQIIVSDDGSSDNSRAIAESFGDRVTSVRSANGSGTGPSATRNRGIHSASHPLIAFLDADDLWLPGHISMMSRAMAAHPEAGLAYDKGYFISEEGKRLGPVFPEPHHPRLTPDELLLDQCFSPGAVIVRRSALDAVGLFDESVWGAEDQDLWLRIIERYPAIHVPFYGFCYRRGDYGQLSLSPKMWEHAERVLQKAVCRYPYTKKAVRKRKAVLAFRFSQIELADRRYLKSTYLLGKAAMLDPARAIEELSERLGQLRKRRSRAHSK
jgi:glycosyltransferase involved in cell wall biosynthesis